MFYWELKVPFEQMVSDSGELACCSMRHAGSSFFLSSVGGSPHSKYPSVCSSSSSDSISSTSSLIGSVEAEEMDNMGGLDSEPPGTGREVLSLKLSLVCVLSKANKNVYNYMNYDFVTKHNFHPPIHQWHILVSVLESNPDRMLVLTSSIQNVSSQNVPVHTAALPAKI